MKSETPSVETRERCAKCSHTLMIDGSIKCPSCANVNHVESDLDLRMEQERTNRHIAESFRMFLLNIHEMHKIMNENFQEVLRERRLAAA